MKALEKEARGKWGQTQAYREYEEKHALTGLNLSVDRESRRNVASPDRDIAVGSVVPYAGKFAENAYPRVKL